MKGQVPIIPLVVGGVFTLLASIGSAWVTASSAASDKIYETKIELNNTDAKLSERTAILETSVPTIQNDIKEIKDGIKEIRNALIQFRVIK
jgi:hypothetical protein